MECYHTALGVLQTQTTTEGYGIKIACSSKISKDFREKESRMPKAKIARNLAKNAQKKTASLNIDALSLQMGRIELNSKAPSKVLRWAQRCPLCINGTMEINKSNVGLIVVSEKTEMFQAIVDEHVRKIPGVKSVSFYPIVKWHHPFYGEINLLTARKKQPPCGMPPYCAGCPSNPKYDGKLWRNSK